MVELRIPLKFLNWQRWTWSSKQSTLPKKDSSFASSQGKPVLSWMLNPASLILLESVISAYNAVFCICFVYDSWLIPDSYTKKGVSLGSEGKNIWTWAPFTSENQPRPFSVWTCTWILLSSFTVPSTPSPNAAKQLCIED